MAQCMTQKKCLNCYVCIFLALKKSQRLQLALSTDVFKIKQDIFIIISG